MGRPLPTGLRPPHSTQVSSGIDERLEALHARSPADDSLEGQRLHRAVRARLLDETVPETKIDRYVVLERLGVGGMGVVYAAHDPQLDRRVAIKLVRNWGGDDRDEDQARLVREAQTLARLSHPNVVGIYDVGLHGDRVFIAMELVRGTTLRQHVAHGTRGWPEITRCFMQAAAGLAAAHAAGIVHRDFKPDNVLVGDDGRVRVLDFGLAYGDGIALTSPGQPSSGITSPSITATGKVAGTPAYMAPEQFAGAPADARSDQFSFCVALWEALHGERPFPATTMQQLRFMITSGAIARPRHPERAPEWLRAVMVRGLATEPDARWPSMQALVDACVPSRRRAWIYGAAMVFGTAALCVGGWALWQAQRRAACERDADEQAAVWNPQTADAIVEAFSATELAHAPASAERVEALLDDYARAWARTHADACLAHLEGTIDDDTRQRREACLDERRERVATLLEVLQAPDRDVVNASVRVAYELPMMAACEDDARLAANAAALDTTLDAARVSDLRRGIARAELLAETERDDAVTVANETRDRALALNDPALVAESELVVGAAHARRGAYQLAADAYERAYFAAGPIGADEVALIASTKLVDMVGSRLARFDEGLAWSRHAEGLLERIGVSRAWREAELADKMALVFRGQGDYEAARASYERSIALRTEFAGPDNPAVGLSWANLGLVLAERRNADAATPALDEGERIVVAAFGPESLQMAGVLSSRGTVAHHLGDYETAALFYARALTIREALQPEHPNTASAMSMLATARLTLDDVAGARVLLERAIDLQRRLLGSSHPRVALALNNLGVVDTHADDLPAALEHLGEALEIRRRVLPADHPETASTLVNLGDVWLRMHEPARALEHYDEAAVMTAGGDEARLREHGRALLGCGLARLELGELAKARADFEGVLATPHADDTDVADKCELHYGLARALLGTDGDGPRVRELARMAHEECTAAGERGEELLGRIAGLLGKEPALARGSTTPE
jgi:tetratricopeptide (TPR) repeat protein